MGVQNERLSDQRKRFLQQAQNHLTNEGAGILSVQAREVTGTRSGCANGSSGLICRHEDCPEFHQWGILCSKCPESACICIGDLSASLRAAQKEQEAGKCLPGGLGAHVEQKNHISWSRGSKMMSSPNLYPSMLPCHGSQQARTFPSGGLLLYYFTCA